MFEEGVVDSFLTQFGRLQPNCVAKVISVENLKKVCELALFFLVGVFFFQSAFKIPSSSLLESVSIPNFFGNVTGRLLCKKGHLCWRGGYL
jgi:hypothetical protein